MKTRILSSAMESTPTVSNASSGSIGRPGAMMLPLTKPVNRLATLSEFMREIGGAGIGRRPPRRVKHYSGAGRQVNIWLRAGDQAPDLAAKPIGDAVDGLSVVTTAVTIHSQRISVVYGPGAGITMPSGVVTSVIRIHTPTPGVSPSTCPTKVHWRSAAVFAAGSPKKILPAWSATAAVRYLPARSKATLSGAHTPVYRKTAAAVPVRAAR